MNADQISSEPRQGAASIRAARANNPKMRERDLAQMLDITEAELVASFVGHGVRRIEPRFDDLFPGLQSVGTVMALTRNESAVHEKIGPFEKFVNGKRAALMLGEQIDTRMFPANWVHGFAVEKADGNDIRRSLQFFDAHGDAVMKIHTRAETDLDAWNALVDKLALEDQTPDVLPEVARADPFRRKSPSEGAETVLRARWQAMTDPHQFHGLLKDLDLDRVSAFELAGDAWAWPLDRGAIPALLRLAASEKIPIMCFVGNRGCIQIHSGPVETVMDKGPWINVMDPTFHLHLRTDHIYEVWAVRKPADIGHVTSIEAYDSDGQQIIQFFGVRGEGNRERTDGAALPKHAELDVRPAGSST
ncbi:hemin degrading factor [Stappia aggregata IAM 12614]|uniref:Hemin degrading factor n=1 Tax=Roseibium aggregatum (strain ATCC 25650 / DSM 13394 / JCM 20685 / NBRC 16684 / NCIMB 2208 / IAM 12614 / B1) TaxID=384765 RepID=A0NY20_ROSAI|nr:hemin-degrading factor [Roseibium aggregatum]EAV42364.1 hemin degrading factor [Stappia aggregata IAM 12614] [Roseibium aggregatum IAM 12614]